MDEHSLQSPYVFKFFKQALKPSKKKTYFYSEIEELREKHISNTRLEINKIQGSGSSMGNKAKNISVIASKGISTRKKSELLLNIINELQSENVLELGTSLGINTLYLSKGNKVAGVKTIEGSVLLAGLAQKNFALCKVKSIELYEEDIQAVLSLFRENNLKFDFVFVDANHTYEATVEYYLELLKITTKEAVVVFDDINWSAGMTKAWNQISQHTSNNLTIENHQLGIVFLGSELENRNYVLNF